jgi:hypothetical protein
VKADSVVRRKGSRILPRQSATNGGEVVRLVRRPPFTSPPPPKIRGTHYCYRLSRPQGHSTAGRIRYIEKIHLIGIRSRNLLDCSTAYPYPANIKLYFSPEIHGSNFGEFFSTRQMSSKYLKRISLFTYSYIETDLPKALLGNDSVNTFQSAIMRAVFSMDESCSSLLDSTTILAKVGEGYFLCACRSTQSPTAQ